MTVLPKCGRTLLIEYTIFSNDGKIQSAPENVAPSRSAYDDENEKRAAAFASGSTPLSAFWVTVAVKPT